MKRGTVLIIAMSLTAGISGLASAQSSSTIPNQTGVTQSLTQPGPRIAAAPENVTGLSGPNPPYLLPAVAARTPNPQIRSGTSR